MIVDESSGKVKYKEIKKGFFGFLTPLYYRYSINFMAIIGELIVNILVLIFASLPTFSFDLGYDLWRNFGLYFLRRCYVGRKNKTNVAVSIKFILERFDYDLGFRYLARV